MEKTEIDYRAIIIVLFGCLGLFATCIQIIVEDFEHWPLYDLVGGIGGFVGVTIFSIGFSEDGD
ncbi:MAG: hypothetical protein GY810_20860 [Aureispira sp.]|nr:hypothetical protein [Aureispira sp.]